MAVAPTTKPLSRPPNLVVHCDWSKDSRKRWGVLAHLNDGYYRVSPPFQVDEADKLFSKLLGGVKHDGHVLAGFDFPIGIPSAYAEKAGIKDFLDILPKLGSEPWKEFFVRADSPQEIKLARPFYPNSAGEEGEHCRGYQAVALGLESHAELLRQCDQKSDHRQAACPIFWCLGGNQVGPATIAGWRELLQPLLRSTLVYAIWPYQGTLDSLTSKYRLVVTETYPGEAYSHLGMPRNQGRTKWSKRKQADRKTRATEVNRWRDSRKGKVEFSADAQAQVDDGFGADATGEDQFDAFVGLCSMIDVVLGHRAEGAPDKPHVRLLEGWILGQQP